MGEAWGPNCELCPSKYSPQYQELCLESGFTVDGQGNLNISNKINEMKPLVLPSVAQRFKVDFKKISKRNNREGVVMVKIRKNLKLTCP